MCEERKPSLDEQIAIAGSKVKPPQNNPDSSNDDEHILEITRDNKPVKQEIER